MPDSRASRLIVALPRTDRGRGCLLGRSEDGLLACNAHNRNLVVDIGNLWTNDCGDGEETDRRGARFVLLGSLLRSAPA